MLSLQLWPAQGRGGEIVVGVWVTFCFDPSDEDDTAELLMELQKIRKERMEEQERKVQSRHYILC